MSEWVEEDEELIYGTRFKMTFCNDSLFLLHVPVTVVGVLAGELVGVRLNRVRIVDLHYLAKVHGLHQFVNLVVVKVVRENQHRLGDVTGLG